MCQKEKGVPAMVGGDALVLWLMRGAALLAHGEKDLAVPGPGVAGYTPTNSVCCAFFAERMRNS